MNHPAHFVITAYHRVKLAAAGELCQIARVFFQRLKFGFGILVGHALRAPHVLQRFQNGVMSNTEAGQNASRRLARLTGQRQQ